MTDQDERFYAAIAYESERIGQRDGVGWTELTAVNRHHFEPDTLVFTYQTPPCLFGTVRDPNVNANGINRLYQDTRIALYIRGNRAFSTLVKREYFDIRTPKLIEWL